MFFFIYQKLRLEVFFDWFTVWEMKTWLTRTRTLTLNPKVNGLSKSSINTFKCSLAVSWKQIKFQLKIHSTFVFFVFVFALQMSTLELMCVNGETVWVTHTKTRNVTSNAVILKLDANKIEYYAVCVRSYVRTYSIQFIWCRIATNGKQKNKVYSDFMYVVSNWMNSTHHQKKKQCLRCHKQYTWKNLTN